MPAQASQRQGMKLYVARRRRNGIIDDIDGIANLGFDDFRDWRVALALSDTIKFDVYIRYQYILPLYFGFSISVTNICMPMTGPVEGEEVV